MSVIAKNLYPSTQLTGAQTTIYTAPTGARALLDKLTAYNASGGNVAVTVHLCPSGGTAGITNVVAFRTIAPGETYTFPEVVGHVLNTGQFVSVLAGTGAAINMRLSGREVTV